MIINIILCYATLYIVIWLHEVGHAVWYWKFGCKKNPLHVTVKPYIFFSTPLPVDMEKMNSITDKQDMIIGYGGIVMNFICTAISLPIVLHSGSMNLYLQLFLWLFCTLHLAEIVSYMFLGNLFLVSDMANIARVKPQLRLPNLLIGIILTVLYVFLLKQLPDELFMMVVIVNICTIVCMGVGRIIFTMMNKKKEA